MKATKISQISACKLTFRSAKLRIRSSIHIDLSEYYANQTSTNPASKWLQIPDFPREATF
jgi:hypothetical protein